MSDFNRRDFLKTGALGAAALALGPAASAAEWPSVHTVDDLVFRPYPHALMPGIDLAYATDADGDPIYDSVLQTTEAGIIVPESLGSQQPFGVSARWFVEGFGNVWLEADNEGQHYTADDFQSGKRTLNLNVEFARSRVTRNQRRMKRYREEGTSFSTEVESLHDLSRQLLEDARQADGQAAGEFANQALNYALWASEKLELEKARSDIQRREQMRDIFFGCETRQYVWAKSASFVDRFVEAFNFATITHYVYDTWYETFEPERGEHRWGIKDNIAEWLIDHDITIEGRPLFWFHPWVTPDWIKSMDFGELKGYVEDHTEALVGHYGDKVHHWEVVNEYHDWANIHNHTPEQITEITRLAMEKTHEVNPNVDRLVNNCCAFGDYVAQAQTASGEAQRPLRTPWQFVRDLVEAEVPFETVGVQMYFPGRDLQNILRLVERFAQFGKPVHITEVGASSGKSDVGALYEWHRPWDEELQADWMEQLYTILYSKPYIESISWYDFADFRTFIPSGGLTEVDGTPKPIYERLQGLLESWGQLPAEARQHGPADERVEWADDLLD